MMICLDACCCKPFLKRQNLWGGGVLCKTNGADKKPLAPKSVNKTEHINIIGYAKVSPDFIFFNIFSADNNNNLCLVLKLKKHLKLAVGQKSRQHSACVVVVKKLSAELKIKLSAEFCNTLLNSA